VRCIPRNSVAAQPDLRGTNSRPEAVAELVGDGLEILWRSAGILPTALGPTSSITAAAVALVVVPGTVLLARARQAQEAPARS
jgi:hypothetical protein